MPRHPIISVILVAWNSKTVLPTCLDRLAAQTFRDFEVILVDNGSEDGGTRGLQERYPSLVLHLEKLDSNRGFAAANNIGARLARGRWLALLNTDAFAQADWLEQLLRAAGENPGFASFSSRQIQADAPELLDGAGDAYHVSGLAWKMDMGYPADGYGLEQKEVFSACGAAALYDREAFLEAGGFDEDYFSYFEDVDLGFRLRLRGHRALYVPQAVVHHVGSATFGLASNFAFYHSHRNLIWTFVKNMPNSMLWRYLPAHLMANLTYLAYYSFRPPGKALWRGKWDAVRGLKRAISKRKEIQLHRCVAPAELRRAMEGGWFKPYLLGIQMRRAQRAANHLRQNR